MKKSLVAVGVIVILGAAWTGISWNTGKTIEDRLPSMLKTANTQLGDNYPNSGLKLVAEDYHRGIFSSSVHIVLQQTNKTENAAVLKPGERIVFLETINHGPLPQLTHFKLTPAIASVHTELQNTPVVKELFDAAKGKSLFTATSLISFNGNSSSEINVLPLNYKKDDSFWEFSGATLNIEYLRDKKATKFNLNSDNLAITTDNRWGDKNKLIFNGIAINSDMHASKFQIGVGEQSISAKNITASVNDKETGSLSGFSLVSKFGEDSKNINGTLNYTLDSLKIQGSDFGGGKLVINVDKLDGQSLKQFADNYEQQMNQLQQLAPDYFKEAYLEQSIAFLDKNLPILLENNPSISVEPLSWKNNKGESALAVHFDLQAPKTTQLTGSTIQNALQFYNKIDTKLTLSLPMVTEFFTQIEKFKGSVTDTDASVLATQQTKEMISMLESFKLVTLKDNTLVSELHYANNLVNVNGEKMTLEKFAGLFGQGEQLDEIPETTPTNNTPSGK